MAKQRKVAEDPIYTFDPNAIEGQSQRYVALHLNELEEPIPLSAGGIEFIQNNDLTSQPYDQRTPWARLIREVLTPDYLASLMAMLRDNSSLPELVTSYLFQHLLKVYQHKVEAKVQKQGIQAVNTTLSHFKLITYAQQNTQTLELVFDDEKIKAYLKSSLSDFFTHASFWEEYARSIGTNLVIWAIESLDINQGSTQSEALDDTQQLKLVKQSSC